MRVSLQAVINQHQIRLQTRQRVLSGGEALANTQRTRARNEVVQTTVGGTVYPIFIIGVDNPDDTTTLRYIP